MDLNSRYMSKIRMGPQHANDIPQILIQIRMAWKKNVGQTLLSF